MFNWHKKEKPLQGLTGMGGGVVSRLFGAGGEFLIPVAVRLMYRVVMQLQQLVITNTFILHHLVVYRLQMMALMLQCLLISCWLGKVDKDNLLEAVAVVLVLLFKKLTMNLDLFQQLLELYQYL